MKDTKIAYRFYKVPDALFENPLYSHLPVETKSLYGVMLSRRELSEENGWRDKNGVYIYFSLPEIGDMFVCGHNKCCKMLSQLEQAKLLTRQRQYGMPSKLYVKDFAGMETVPVSPPSQEPVSAVPTEPSEPDYLTNEMMARMSFWVDELFYDPNSDRDAPYVVHFDHIKKIMTDALAMPGKYIRIGTKRIAREIVMNKFKQLTNEDVYHVIEMLWENQSKIKSYNAYILTSLLNEVKEY